MENITEIKGIVSFEDLMKVDIRIGVVEEAESIEGTELIKQQVNFGSIGKKQIVSKIAKFYTPADLISKKFAYVLNLPVRKIRGVESEGMIIGAEDPENKKLALLNVEFVSPGSIVF